MLSNAKIVSKLESLDYMKNGDGLIEKQMMNLTSNEAFLFIGIGGKGTMILSELKKKMKMNIKKEDLFSTAFLAVDTDRDVKYDDLGFEMSEIFELYGGDKVYMSTRPDTCTKEIKEWINPMLSSVIRSEVAFSNTGKNY